MASGEEATPTKSSKPASSAQEAPSTPATPAYPDWSSSMQAFYSAGATLPFFASTVASPTPHPFLWGSQHPLMPPYGTPVPYPALYSPGGVYAHPNMVVAPGIHTPVNFPGNADLDKGIEGKDRPSSKKAKKTSGINVKAGDMGKAASGSGNDVGTQSCESGSEGSSDSSDEHTQGFRASKKGSFDQMLADGANAQNNVNSQTSVPGNLANSGSATNLNIGMDLWSAPLAGSAAMLLRPNLPAISPSGNPPGMINEWVQDERDLKRQKRKQSNRESARRSRLRKQAECEELQQRVEALTNENHKLKDELQRLSEECKKLASENNSIKEELVRLFGPDSV